MAMEASKMEALGKEIFALKLKNSELQVVVISSKEKSPVWRCSFLS
jgi:hypothetical protein